MTSGLDWVGEEIVEQQMKKIELSTFYFITSP
jgi:hypothetical protein